MPFNLRADASTIPGPVYISSYAWGTDVPTGTGVLSLWNPISSSVTACVMDMTVGAWNTGTTNASVTFELYKAVLVTPGTIISINLFDALAPVSQVVSYAGGSWTLLSRVAVWNTNTKTSQGHIPINLTTPMKISPGNGLVMVYATESANVTLFPNCSFTWYEV